MSIPGTVHITFYGVHWYSFIRKIKIERIKEIIKNESSVCIYWDYKITNKKKDN